MTVQYQGLDNFKIFIGGKEVELTMQEIKEIQNYDFDKMEVCDFVESYEKVIENNYEINQELHEFCLEYDEVIDDEGMEKLAKCLQKLEIYY